jgi:nickel-type superoxide dismutase maturation protease
MLPTLREGDRLLARRIGKVSCGDVVLVRHPTDEQLVLVKRIAGREGTRFVVLGDNAAASVDSRQFGPVERRALLGRCYYRYAPPWRAGWIDRVPPRARERH